MTKFGRLTGKPFNCQFNLNVSMKLLKTFFVYKYKLSIALLYLADMFINKHKTKLNVLFTERFWIQTEFTTLFEGMSPQDLSKCPQKFYFVGKKTWRPILYKFIHCHVHVACLNNIFHPSNSKIEVDWSH